MEPAAKSSAVKKDKKEKKEKKDKKEKAEKNKKAKFNEKDLDGGRLAEQGASSSEGSSSKRHRGKKKAVAASSEADLGDQTREPAAELNVSKPSKKRVKTSDADGKAAATSAPSFASVLFGGSSASTQYSSGDLGKSLLGADSATDLPIFSVPAPVRAAAPPAAPAPGSESDEDSEEDEGPTALYREDPRPDAEEAAATEAEAAQLEQERIQEEREQQDEEKLARTVFVGNVPLETTRKALSKLFAQYGTVQSVRLRSVAMAKQSLIHKRKIGVITKQFHPLRATCNAYVVFSSRAEAEAALALNNHVLDERHLRVDLADNTNKYAEASLSVFIGNVPFDAEEEDVRAHFAPCGEVVSVRLVRDKETNVGKGIGFVKFADRDGVASALLLNGNKLGKRELRVLSAKDHKVVPKRWKQRAAQDATDRDQAKKRRSHERRQGQHGGNPNKRPRREESSRPASGAVGRLAAKARREQESSGGTPSFQGRHARVDEVPKIKKAKKLAGARGGKPPKKKSKGGEKGRRSK